MVDEAITMTVLWGSVDNGEESIVNGHTEASRMVPEQADVHVENCQVQG